MLFLCCTFNYILCLIFQHQPDLGIGVHLMDRYTFYVLEFLEEIHPASQTNMNDLVSANELLICAIVSISATQLKFLNV